MEPRIMPPGDRCPATRRDTYRWLWPAVAVLSAGLWLAAEYGQARETAQYRAQIRTDVAALKVTRARLPVESLQDRQIRALEKRVAALERHALDQQLKRPTRP